MSEPLFHLAFDGSPNAVTAEGEAPPRVYGDPLYVPGVSGRALVVGGDRKVTFKAREHVPAAEGTLMLWAQPRDWTPATSNFIFFATVVGVVDGKLNRLMLYKTHNTMDVTLLANSAADGRTGVVRCPVASWLQGEWRHLAVTWDRKQIRAYVNGKPAGETEGPDFRPKCWSDLIVGTAYPGWAYIGAEMTAIDELTLFGRALRAAEVKQAFASALNNNAEVAAFFAAARKRREERVQNDLATKGAFVLASSFKDYKAFYTDNLIDADPNSAWTPKEAGYPQWLELHWRYPVRINRAAVEELVPGSVTAATVLTRRDGAWQTLGAARDMTEGPYKEIAFPEVTTDRLRVVLEQGDVPAPVLSALEAFGPPQPLVGANEPYWDAWYIWYPEPDKVHKANAPRYFRKTFVIQDLAAMISAYLQARSNDYYKLFVNGTEVATGSTDIRAIDVKATLREGTNIVCAITDLGSNPGQWGWGEFITELSMNYRGESIRIGTDTSWRSHNAEVEGWKTAAFDDSSWLPAAPYLRPPGGPWGRIAYTCTRVRQWAKVTGATVAPAIARPGDTVDVTIRLVPNRVFANDYFFIVELGERAVVRHHGDFSVARCLVEPDPPATTWQAGQEVSLATALHLPEFAPDGSVPLSVRGVDRTTGVELGLVNADGKATNEFATVRIERAQGDAIARDPVTNRLSFQNGQAGFALGNRVEPPVFWRYAPLNSFERAYKYTAGADLHMHHFMIYPAVIDVDRNKWATGLAELDQNITNTLRVDPRADVMVLVDLRPTTLWKKAHPDELLVNGFGGPGPICYASRTYEQEVHAYLRHLIAFLKSKSYFGRVIAIKPMTCGVPDSGMGGVSINTWQTDRTKITVGDFNPLAVAAFRAWLRNKYGNDVARLRAAWKQDAVSFDTATPVLADLVREGENGGVFRDPSKGRMPFDYFEFLPRLLGSFYQRVAKLIKDETDGKVMVMMHYGYVIAHMTACNSPGGAFNNNNFDFPQMLEDPNIDAYLGAPDYGHRRAGDAYALYFPVDSITLHRRQYIADGDYRTFVAHPVIHGRQRSDRETEAVLKKDLASCIIGNTGTWLSDMGRGTGRSGHPWFQERSTLDTIGGMQRIFREAMETERVPASQIAVFFSTTTPQYHDAYYASVIYRNLIVWTYWGDMHRIGAPFDTYMMSDLAHPDIRQDYKLYVFMNPFHMSDTERQAVEALKREGKTLLWFYAPGYVDDARGLDAAHTADVTGLGIRQKPGREHMRCTVTDVPHPVTAGLGTNHTYQVRGYGHPTSKKLHPAAFGPVFHVADTQAASLALYPDGNTAMAARDFGTWKSIYTGLPTVDAATLRNAARYAGVHLYCDEDIVMDADNRFVMLHNGYGAPRTVTVRLPEKRDVVDAFTGEAVAAGTDTFEAQLEECQTLLYRLR